VFEILRREAALAVRRTQGGVVGEPIGHAVSLRRGPPSTERADSQ
jgi:hypothetical protein